jgi:hypothetical protein
MMANWASYSDDGTGQSTEKRISAVYYCITVTAMSGGWFWSVQRVEAGENHAWRSADSFALVGLVGRL